ncbi:hypothetical protein V7128_22775 [Neobacillus vireti]|uniref:hypothetical protein n=1 Tax=Neobacillus vireti TaxID=220686 RepID=UPI002FFDCC7E
MREVILEPTIREERRRLFRNELYRLREEGYLSSGVVETVAKAHQQYHLDLLREEELKQKQMDTQPIHFPSPKTVKVKNTLNPEAIRERNITWSLNIGVIFLLVGGLFVATSNWDTMTGLMKSSSIAIVSLLFYGIALISKRILHIEKTAFAFTVLGSLFLPIFILSLGWFGLLGPYLSIKGGGGYLLGLLGSLLSLTVYILFAKNLGSRLFVWFALVSITIGAAFLLAATHLKGDFFYLGMVSFDVVFILAFQRIKNIPSFQLFSNEFVPYIQVNLILTTLFMLLLFNNDFLYSFNVLFTAAIYLSMIYVTGRKEYHFVFTVMLAFGVYQLVENSFLQNAGSIVYALVAFGFVFVPKAIDHKFSLERAFQYTSAVVSGLAFIYISLEGILVRTGQPSVVLLISYLIMAGNLIYLTNNISGLIFPYLSSLFLLSGIYEGVSLLTGPFEEINLALRVFITGFILFCIFVATRLMKYVERIRHGAVMVGLASMAIALALSVFFQYWWELGVMLLLTAVSAYLFHQHQDRSDLKEAAYWILPSAIGLSIVAFGEESSVNFLLYRSLLGEPIHFAAGAFLVLISSMIWRKISKHTFARSSLIVSQALYTIAIIHAIVSPINHTWGQPLVMAAGIGMYSYFYRMIRTKWIPYFISITTLFCYFSVLNSITEKLSFSQQFHSLVPSGSGIVLLVIASLFRKGNSELAAAFAWVGHLILPIALVFTWFIYPFDSIYSFILAFSGYAVSTICAQTEWKKKVFLYGGFTALFIAILTGMDRINYYEQYSFPITSLLLLVYFLSVGESYKRRATFYSVPFSFIGIASMMSVYPYNFLAYILTCLYVVGILFYLHKVKWGILVIVPMILAFLATVEYTDFNMWTDSEKLFVFAIIGVVLLCVGQFLYKKLFEPSKKILEVILDGYTVAVPLYFVYMYSFELQPFWLNALPGVLIAITIWLQRKRVPAKYAHFLSIAAGGYLLQPYYAMISLIHIPSLWLREVYVYPCILLIIFIRRCLKGKYADVVKLLQWVVLVGVSLILIQDALASHTIYDAIILGSLALVSMVAGMFTHIKSYFFVGAGVLLLNLFLQTRPYWGNMPWWVYLLAAGLILISIASFNEWHKQKTQKGESTFITYLKLKIIDKIRKWN